MEVRGRPSPELVSNNDFANLETNELSYVEPSVLEDVTDRFRLILHERLLDQNVFCNQVFICPSAIFSAICGGLPVASALALAISFSLARIAGDTSSRSNRGRRRLDGGDMHAQILEHYRVCRTLRLHEHAERTIVMDVLAEHATR